MTTGGALDNLVGRTLGEYVLRQLIGEGGFGGVYRALQPALDREAVVKVLHTRMRGARAAPERFLREAKLASKLDHPYAAHIYGFGAEADGELWIAMELVRGTPLDEILRFQGPLPLERFVPLLDRICEVVHTAHEQGIVHRDLKPANVMVLARAGRLLPKLLDFGIAKALDQAPSGPGDGAAFDDTAAAALTVPNRPTSGDTLTSDPGPRGSARPPTHAQALTQVGSAMGSPPYMAPEQWLDATQVDARTDLYALGILAYESLTGRRPFTGATVTAIATAHAMDPVPPVGATLPAALDAVFERALAKAPADRFVDALAFAAAIRQASGIGAEPDGLPGLDGPVREAAVASAPQPIAEAVAALEAARNPHQARAATWQLVRTAVRYLALVAIACRTRVSGKSDPAGVADLLRALYRRPLTDLEWLELARELTRAWKGCRDACPVPELVDLFHDAVPGAAVLDLLLAERETAEATVADAAVRLQLERILADASRLLRALEFLSAYPLVVAVAGGIAERWTGVHRAQRTTAPVRGLGLAPGTVALLDSEGVPVLVLEPLIQVAAPAPGSPLELFLFDGRGRRGAKLVALPHGFEHHDDSLWDWFRSQLASNLDDVDATTGEERAPYRGLSAFSAEDGAVFFGRERLVDAVTNRLRVQPLITIVGRSGAGKSSFVHAGVIPALPPGWRAVSIRPGPTPLATLVARLQAMGFATDGLRGALERDRDALGDLLRADAARGSVLVLVDQLEEVFTLCVDPDERRIYVEALVAAARSADDPVRVVFTLRDDFLVRAEQMPALRNRLGPSLQLVTVPVADDLLRILIEPARRARYELEGELASEMVKDVADQPGALALLSFTASRLWELRDRHFKQLTRKAYQSLGGVGGALAQHAEQTLAEMTGEERRLTREAFRHLVTTENTRAVLGRAELLQLLGADAQADAVIEKLVASRLVVTSEDESGGDRIEIVHEALLVAWPRLVEWRREDAEGTRLREQLRAAAKQWDARMRPNGLLWRGDALAEYTRWRARHHGPLTDVEAAFATASVQDAARGRRIRRGLIAAAFVVLAAGIVVLFTINTDKEDERRRAEASERIARVQVAQLYLEQGRQLYLAGDPFRAAVYLDAARLGGATGPDLEYLLRRTKSVLDKRLATVGSTAGVLDGAFGRDGRVFTASADGVQVWDARDGKLLATLSDDTARVRVVVPSPDGLRLASGGDDNTARIWDIATGALVRTLTGHTGWIAGLAWTPDGSRVITISLDGTARIWNTTDGAQVAEVPAAMPPAGAMITFSADGRAFYLAAPDGSLVRRDARTGAAIAAIDRGAAVNAMAESPDRSRVAVVRDDATLTLRSADDGHSIWRVGLPAPGHGVAFAAGGTRIAVVIGDEIPIFDAATGTRLAVMTGHRGAITGLSVRADGALLASSSQDSSVRLWDPVAATEVMLVPGTDALDWVVLSPDGERLFTGGRSSRATIWTARPDVRHLTRNGFGADTESLSVARDGKRVVTCAGHRFWVWSEDGTVATVDLPATSEGCLVAASPDGSWVVLATDGAPVIWDVATGATVRTLGGADDQALTDLVVSADGTRVLTAHGDGTIRIWNVRTGELQRSFAAHTGHVYAAWSADGTRILTCGSDQVVKVWGVDGTLAHELPHDGMCSTVAFSRDGRQVLAGSGKAARVWNTADWRLDVVLEGHQGMVYSATFTPDGLIVTGSADRSVRVWDARSGKALDVLPHPSDAFGGAMTRHGLITASGEDLYEWDLGADLTWQPEVIEQLPFVLRNGLIFPRAVR